MDLFDTLDRDETAKASIKTEETGTRSRPILIDDSLQTMEPLLDREIAALGTASGIPLSVDEPSMEESEKMSDFKSAVSNQTPDQPLTKQDDVSASLGEQHRGLSSYLPHFGSQSSSSSADSQFKDLPKQVRESETGAWEKGSSGSNSDNTSSDKGSDLYHQYQDLPRSVIDSESGKLESGSSSQGNSKRGSEIIAAPQAGDGNGVQDLDSHTVGDELPQRASQRYKVNVGSSPAPVSASATSLEAVNDEERTTRLEPSTLWPFSHTVKKREVIEEPKDASAKEPSVLMKGFNAAHAKLDSAAEKVRNAVDSFAEKNLRYEPNPHQNENITPTADIPSLVNTADEENADVIRSRMHPSHEREEHSTHQAQGNRNVYS